MEIVTVAISIVSLCLMIGLHYRTTLLEKRIANRTRDTLEFMANLIINAASDPDIIRRLILDYQKTGTWRGGVFYNGDKHHAIAWKIPEPERIAVGNLKIAIVRQPIEGNNTLG